MSNIDERAERSELLATSNLTKKIQFNPEYINNIEHFFDLPQEKRIVLLHSVRGAGSEEPEFITKYVKEQEALGNAVYIPKKFNFQKDETGGIAICNTMRYVIQNSGQAAIGYNPDSEGTKFDYGITIFTNKPITLLNPGLELKVADPVYESMKKSSENKTNPIINAIDEYENTTYNGEIPIGLRYIEWFGTIRINHTVGLELEYTARPDKDGKPVPPALSPISAVELGMLYASQKPFFIVNVDKVKAQSDLEDKLGFFKSYSKVALKLHEIYDSQ